MATINTPATETEAYVAAFVRGADGYVALSAPVCLPPESVAKIADVREAGLERLGKMHEAGVLMGYGSDLLGGMQTAQSGEFPLRGQYMPADAVIRSATVDAARVLRMEGQIGAITPGAFADVIAVEGNPLEDLSLLTGQGAHMPLIMKDGVAVKKASAL